MYIIVTPNGLAIKHTVNAKQLQAFIRNQFGGLYDLYCIDIENLSRNISLRRYETEHLFHRVGDSYIFPISFLFCFHFLGVFFVLFFVFVVLGGFFVWFCFVCLFGFFFFFAFAVFVYMHELKFVSKL